MARTDLHGLPRSGAGRNQACNCLAIRFGPTYDGSDKIGRIALAAGTTAANISRGFALGTRITAIDRGTTVRM